MAKAPWVVPGTEPQAHGPPHPVSPAVSILPGGPEEPDDLILEEVDPHWEEDLPQDGSTGPQGAEAVASAHVEENEAGAEMSRWEPGEALSNDWEDNRHLARNLEDLQGRREWAKPASPSLLSPRHPSLSQVLLCHSRDHLSTCKRGLPSFYFYLQSIACTCLAALGYIHLAIRLVIFPPSVHRDGSLFFFLMNASYSIIRMCQN